ncbi:DNA helicase recq [Penicillium atrosanguineum]|nr:DNA helicase recq [Penicillium atrosanguineum]
MAEEPAIQPSPSPPLEALRETFHYYTPFRIMICQPCRCVVFDAQINRHLRLHHKGQDKAQFRPKEVLSYFEDFPLRIQSVEDLALPSEPIPAVPFLSINQDTFQCGESSCRWIGGTLLRIQEHYRHQHGWTAPPASDRLTSIAPWAPILSQRFIPRGPGSQRFAVSPPTSDDSLLYHPPARTSTPLSNRLPQPSAAPAKVLSPSAPARLPLPNPPQQSSASLTKSPLSREPAKTPTLLSSPPIASRLSLAHSELQDSTAQRLRTTRSQSRAQQPTSAPAQSPQIALDSAYAPRTTTQATTDNDEPRARPSNPPDHPRKRQRASKEPSARSLSSTPRPTAIESDQRPTRASLAPAQSRRQTMSKEPRALPSRIPVPPMSTHERARLESPEETLTRALEDWARECPVCRAEGLSPSARAHQLISCEGANAELVRQESTQLLQRLKTRSGSCRGCGLPKSFCDRFKDRSHRAKLLTRDRTCYAPRIMAATIISIGIFDTPRFEMTLGWIEGGDIIDMEDSEKVYQWFTQEVPFLDMAATRLTQVFYRLYCTAGLPVVLDSLG